MDFTFDDEQQALQDMARRFLTEACADYEHVRATASSELGYDPDIVSRLAQQGLLGLAVAEDDGGGGASVIEAAVVAREIGRAMAPVPYSAMVSSALLVAAAGSRPMRSEILPSVCAGESLVLLAHAEPGALWEAQASSVKAIPTSGGWALTGTKEPVTHGAEADHLLVTAALPDGGTGVFVVAGDAAGVERKGYRATGAGRAAHLSFRDTPAAALDGSAGDTTAHVERTLCLARILAGQESLGAMQAALRLTTTYLTQRRQFGTTLNTFQALTFRAADMYVEIELAESLVQWATMVAAEPNSADLLGAATRAALQVARAGRQVAQEAIQLHGGIGMTAEHQIGGYARRLTAFNQEHGTWTHHLRRLAEDIDAHDVLDPLQPGMV